MLSQDESVNSLSQLLGEDSNTSSSNNNIDLDKNEESTNETNEAEYDPFKVLEESSYNLLNNIELEDAIDIDNDPNQ